MKVDHHSIVGRLWKHLITMEYDQDYWFWCFVRIQSHARPRDTFTLRIHRRLYSYSSTQLTLFRTTLIYYPSSVIRYTVPAQVMSLRKYTLLVASSILYCLMFISLSLWQCSIGYTWCQADLTIRALLGFLSSAHLSDASHIISLQILPPFCRPKLNTKGLYHIMALISLTSKWCFALKPIVKTFKSRIESIPRSIQKVSQSPVRFIVRPSGKKTIINARKLYSLTWQSKCPRFAQSPQPVHLQWNIAFMTDRPKCGRPVFP